MDLYAINLYKLVLLMVHAKGSNYVSSKTCEYT